MDPASATRIELAHALPRKVLALGSETKNTVCCAADTRAYLSSVHADVGQAAEYEAFITAVHTWPIELGITPEVLAYDLHPEYVAHKVAQWPELWPAAQRVGVQHHAAHIAATAVAEGVWEDCWGVACDGTGYGTDGTLWGGEILRGSVTRGFTRMAHLRAIQLPGGTAAIREPWRIAVALAHAAKIEWPRPHNVSKHAWDLVHALCTSTAMRPVLSSSAGRLFDGVAALLGVCYHAEREAQAAVALEQCASDVPTTVTYPLPYKHREDGTVEFDWVPLVRSLWEDYCAGVPREVIAARFHDSVAHAFAEFCGHTAGPQVVVCGGGVFFNRRFTRVLRARVEAAGLRCVVPQRLPPSDAAISLGQAALAAFCAVAHA